MEFEKKPNICHHPINIYHTKYLSVVYIMYTVMKTFSSHHMPITSQPNFHGDIPRKQVEIAWECDKKSGGFCGKEADHNRSAREEEERKAKE